MPKARTIELNKAHWPVTVLGPGRRIGLWVQGCSIHCPGCVSQDTWPKDAARRIAIAKAHAEGRWENNGEAKDEMAIARVRYRE